MVINVEIISKEMIKPSSPTPIHLKTHKLSFLDQISSAVYAPFIFFYHYHQLRTHNTNLEEISKLLKQSLSKILTIFYPLGGRIHGNLSVDCDDSGVEFIEARARTQLSKLLEDPNAEEIKKLQHVGQDETVVLAVKTSIFDCGGVAIAVCMSHKVADATSHVAFINEWAAACRGETKILNPTFDLASSFPPRPLSDIEFITSQYTGITKEKIVSKRFVFNKEKLAKIKEITSTSSTEATRVVAVSSYIWRRIMEAKTTSFAANSPVNLRPRKNPPISQHMFGNCWANGVAFAKADESYSDLARKLTAAIRSINDEFIQRVENGEYFNDLRRLVDLNVQSDHVEWCSFSSLCRLPVYDVDFGWGRPEWVCTTALPYKNVVVLMSTPCGEGIEAWVSLLEDDMEMFQL